MFGFIKNQLQNVVEWNEFRDDIIFFKYDSDEIKKDSRLIIKPGQDAIFLKDGKIEGIFTDEGSYDIESDIIPFLTTLRSFKFGFNTPLRAQILFVNTKEFIDKWGTTNPISIRTPNLPSGMPIRAFGSYSFKVSDYTNLIEKVAGIKKIYTTDDIRQRVITELNQLLMKWIGIEGKDMFDLQSSAHEISNGIKKDLDMILFSLGLSITAFTIESFSYPPEVLKMQEKVAGQSMVNDVDKYTKINLADSLKNNSGNIASSALQMQMAMNMGKDMMNNTSNTHSSSQKPNFCPNCGTKTGGANFCPNCGQQL